MATRLPVPRKGTNDRIKYDLLVRVRGAVHGATLDEINQAAGDKAWSYINDTRRLARRCGGTPHWTDGGSGQRRFWVTNP
jgi:hypothetical protein